MNVLCMIPGLKPSSADTYHVFLRLACLPILRSLIANSSIYNYVAALRVLVGTIQYSFIQSLIRSFYT